jgi:integrase
VELASLTLDHLDVGRGILKLYEGDDKARVSREQPIPSALADKLAAFGKSREALELYRQHTTRKDAKMKYPENPLLFVPQHTARMLTEDLERLGIPKWTEEGKLDFHSLRVAYVNLLFKSQADVKTAQELARHSDARLTLITYGRAQAERKHATVEAAYELIHGRKKVQ